MTTTPSWKGRAPAETGERRDRAREQNESSDHLASPGGYGIVIVFAGVGALDPHAFAAETLIRYVP